PNATYWLLVASKGDAGATGAGLIAVNAYAPGSDGLTSSTSTSFVDVDATNQAVTFTAPASGNVLVRVTATIGNTNATWNTFVGLRESTTNLSNTSRITDSSSGTVVLPQSFVYYLTGLASGSHTFKLAFRTENAATAV